MNEPSMASLYPFLYSDRSDLDRVVAEVERSIVAKAAEIVELRDHLAERYGDALARCANALAEAFATGARLYCFGNGGSSTDAAAVAQLFVHPGRGRPLPAISLATDVAVLTALSNDVDFEVVFARQLSAFGRPGDIALGLSTSGGSANVLAAFDQAKRIGMVTVGFAGYDGGRMREAATIDHLFVVPSTSVHRIQEAQTTTYNILWELVQMAFGNRR
jgi:D-sedoheptulose 7-phosphate isomerase